MSHDLLVMLASAALILTGYVLGRRKKKADGEDEEEDEEDQRRRKENAIVQDVENALAGKKPDVDLLTTRKACIRCGLPALRFTVSARCFGDSKKKCPTSQPHFHVTCGNNHSTGCNTEWLEDVPENMDYDDDED